MVGEGELNWEELLELWSLGVVKNIESVYCICFGELDSADSAIKADFETARNLRLLSLEALMSYILSLDHLALTYLYLPLSALVSKTCQKNYRCS